MQSKQQSCNSFFSAVAVPAALATAIVFGLMTPALAQSAVPPTARQAAAEPAFASRLARQVPAHPATKAQAAGRARGASPQDQILYDNGSYNGTNDAWTINFGFSASNSFTVPSNSNIDSLHFVYWDASTSDLLTSVDLQLGSTSFGGSPQTLTGATNTFLGINQFGYALYQADYSFSSIPWSGAGYVTLSNACSTSGCSVSNPIYWDENSGPSTAYENNLGSIPSETFSLGGGSGPVCVDDEPADGFKVIHKFTDFSAGIPDGGLAIDQAENLYGTTTNYDNLGAIYKLTASGEDWIFKVLYKFLGGVDGRRSSPVIVGPDGAFYGTADGGIACDPGYYCGVVYKLTLSPAACRTALCSWTKTVLYSFKGAPDGYYPYGNLVFDQAGNLYGTTSLGGTYGHGTVYELTPSRGGWTEKLVYSFTGAGDGGGPDSLLFGQDGNLYGTTYAGGYGEGEVIFQLVPSGGSWTEHIIASYDGCGHDRGSCQPLLIQENSGNFYGTEQYVVYQCYAWGCNLNTFGIIFVMSPSGGGWHLSSIDDTWDYYGGRGLDDFGLDVFNDLAIDPAENLYGAEVSNICCDSRSSKVFKLLHPDEEKQLIGFGTVDFENLAVGASGKLYGTFVCGSEQGRVWQLTPQQ